MAIFDNIGGLLGDLSDYGFGVPKNTGLISDTADIDAINRRALMSGLINAGLTYAATPKNLNVGSPLPYLGRAALAGFNTSQDVVDRALNTAYRNRMLAGRDDGFANINPLDVTPESLKLYIEGGKKDPSILRRAAPVEKPQGPMVVSPGSTVYNPITNEVQFTAPTTPKEDKNIGTIDPDKFTTESIEKFKGSGKYSDLKRIESPNEKLSFKDIYGGKPQLDVNGKPIFIPNLPGYPILDANKRVVENVQLPQKADEKLTEGERTAGFLSKRLNNSLQQLQAVTGQKPSAAAPNLKAEATKFFTGSDYFKNLATPESRQQVEAAQYDILDSALTLGTGAAYTREQLDSYRKSYFPQLGDKPKTIQDKATRLQGLLDAAYEKAGRAASQQSTTTNVQPTAQPNRAYIGNRAIIVKNNQWVYEDTGEVAQ